MINKKKKLSKKEIKEDKLVTTYYKSLAFFEENKQRLSIYLGVFIVVVAALFFYFSQREKKNDEAQLQLSRVMQIYDNGSYLEAIEGRPAQNIIGLRKIVEDYSGTEFGEAAKIYLANSYFMLGNLEDAYNYYKDYSGSNDLFTATAYTGQASYFESKDEFEKAGELFRKAAFVSKENVLNPEYLLKAGINYLNANKHTAAKDMFERIKKDYASSQAMRDVDRYLVLVN